MSVTVRSNDKPSPPPTTPAPAAVASVETQPEAGLVESTESSASSKETFTETKQEAPASETEEPSEVAPKEGEPKKKGGFQRRIDKLNAQRAQAQQEMEYWKGMALKGAGSKTEVTPAAQSPVSVPGKPNADRFDTHSEFVEALADWKLEQKLRERDQKSSQDRFQEEQAKMTATFVERRDSFAGKTTDYQDVVAEVDHIPLSPALRDIFLTSDNGPELAYELAKNPAEYERINKLPPLACAREMGKMEFRLSSSKGSSAISEKKITHAPKPIDPVGTGGKGTTGKSITDPNLSQREYEAIRREQIKKRRQAG